MADFFYNPYQFIPVTGKVNGKPTSTVPFESIKTGQHPVRHDAWQKDRLSGRIVCAVHLQTPTLVGGVHIQDDPSEAAEVQPYEIDGRPAIPGNSLRGMVGAVAEALSQSALRVLRDETYSLRKQMQAGESLSAIGMVKYVKKKPYILPLTMPNLELPGETQEKWKKAFGEEKLRMCMGAYVNGYRFNNDRAFHTGFLESHRPHCYHQKRQQFFYAKLSKDLDQIGLADISKIRRYLHIKNERFVLGQRILDDDIRSEPEFVKLLTEQTSLQDKARIQTEYVRGFLYVLGIDGRATEIPHTKKHERFIPYPEGRKSRGIPIQSAALDTFKNIAKQRAEAAEEKEVSLPFLPNGYSFDEFKKNDYKPLDGDLMYFDLEKSPDGGYQVNEISYSAIWRKAIKGTVHQAFAKINPNLTPWGHPSRKGALTPAEALFGVVTDRKLTDKPESLNLASRLRFHDAKPLDDLQMLPPTLLKALSSPKPPAPCLYFHSSSPQVPVKKANLDLESHIPNGRKVYIPHSAKQIDSQDWGTDDETLRPHLKMRCTPMASEQSLYFHIDFENLDAAELSLLKTALRPDAGFLHRLGLGKPLGLGAVQLEILGVFYLDRINRYSVAGLNASRYAKLTRVSTHWPEPLASRYPHEAAMFMNPEIATVPMAKDDSYIDRETKRAMVHLGSVNSYDPTIPVRYPYSKAQIETDETEIFQWFVNNEKSTGHDYQTLPRATPGARLKLRRN